MFISFLGSYSSSCRTVDKADLDQIRFIDIFQRGRFLTDGIGQRIQADRAALEAVNDAAQITDIHFIKSQGIDVQTIE